MTTSRVTSDENFVKMMQRKFRRLPVQHCGNSDKHWLGPYPQNLTVNMIELCCDLFHQKGLQGGVEGRSQGDKQARGRGVGNWKKTFTLQWRHNGRDSVSDHQRLECLFNRLFRRRSENIKAPVIGLCEGNSPVTGEFPSHRASNAENVSIWWRQHDITGCRVCFNMNILELPFKKIRS